LPDSSELAPDQLEDGVGLRKLPGLEFGMDGLSIDAHLERAAAGWDEPHRSDPLLELEEYGCQTDSLRFIVSSRAIFDGNFRAHN
jgi:hypothetical protein